ncbi:hypothetical protein D7V86_15215 [bacterium D16-51]|nr:hypothetical protein D7V96_20630 [bacterium D16-59]RKI58775.1 hypothetical protein D7V86_15215 [bacterium D16-51]
MARARGQAMIQNEQMPVQEKLLYFSIGFIAVGYFAILFAASWSPGCDFLEWFHSFNQFVLIEHHFIVGFTEVTGQTFCILEAIWTLAYLYYITKIQHPFAGREHGDARWGNAKEFSKAYSNADSKNLVTVKFGDCPEPVRPVVVNTHNYWLADGVYVNIDNKLTSNLNILVVGPPGTGKSFRLSRPVLSQLAGNYLVTDPKGELSKQTGQFFEDNGYEVLVLNIESEESMEHSIHFNPFRYLRNESDIMSLAQILFKATTNPEEGNSGDAFFEQTAETLMTDLLYLMHYTYPDEDKDWAHFVELLESTIVKANEQTGGIDNSDPNGILNRFERANENWLNGLYTKEKPTEDLKGLVDIRKFYNGAQETTSSIVASLDAHCRYMKLQCVKNLLSVDDIDIKNSFGYCKKTKGSPTGKRILYIVTSEDKRYYDWITSMVYSLFFDELYHLTAIDASLHDTLPEHLTFLMDEFANVTLPDSFVEKLSTMRSRGMSAIVIIQNLIQLKRKFPKFDMDKDLIANMSIIDILGAPDQDSCEYLSKAFGNRTIHKQTTGLSRGTQGSFSDNEDVMQMPLFSPEEMYRMNKDGPCAIVVKGTDPLFVPKCKFEKSPLYPLLTRKVPYVTKLNDGFKVQVLDRKKSPCEQIPEFFIGREADEYLEKCKADGNIKILKLTEQDIDSLSILERENKEILGKDASTKEFWKQIRIQTEKAVKEKAARELNFDQYDAKELLVVQRLKNAGFSSRQIKALESLIKAEIAFDEITLYFNTEMPVTEIENMAPRLAAAKEVSK